MTRARNAKGRPCTRELSYPALVVALAVSVAPWITGILSPCFGGEDAPGDVVVFSNWDHPLGSGNLAMLACENLGLTVDRVGSAAELGGALDGRLRTLAIVVIESDEDPHENARVLDVVEGWVDIGGSLILMHSRLDRDEDPDRPLYRAMGVELISGLSGPPTIDWDASEHPIASSRGSLLGVWRPDGDRWSDAADLVRARPGHRAVVGPSGSGPGALIVASESGGTIYNAFLGSNFHPDLSFVLFRNEVAFFLEQDLDRDDDEIADSVEVRVGLDPDDPDDADADPDGDLLISRDEVRARTDPFDPDSDGGGLLDGFEVEMGRDPRRAIDDAFELRVLVWTHDDPPTGAVNALERSLPLFVDGVTVTRSDDPFSDSASDLLRSAHVLIVPPWRSVDAGLVEGSRHGAALRDFAGRQGVVVAFGRSGAVLLGAADVLVALPRDDRTRDSVFPVVDPSHLLARGLRSTLRGEDTTTPFGVVDAEVAIVVAGTRPGESVVAVKDEGSGSAVLIGFSHQTFDDDSMRVAANAVALAALRGDGDGDGIPDADEHRLGLDPRGASDGVTDLDGDGLDNAREFRLGTDPRHADTDGDGLSDLREVDVTSTDPRRADTDGDGVGDASDERPLTRIDARLEVAGAALRGVAFAVRLRLTVDGEPASGPLEITLGLSQDAVFASHARAGRLVAGGGSSTVVLETVDGVAEIDLVASSVGSVAVAIVDSRESDVALSASGGTVEVPVLEAEGDADEDGLSSRRELELGTDPLRADTDDDGLRDGDEMTARTDPLRPDSDGGGASDAREVAVGFDPLVSSDDPPLEVVVWTAHADTGATGEVANTVAALRDHYPHFELLEVERDGNDVLVGALQRADVLLLPELERLVDARARGAELGDVLRGFLRRGGLVLALSRDSVDLLAGAGILAATPVAPSAPSEPLTVVEPGHELTRSLPRSFPSVGFMSAWTFDDPDVSSIVERDADGASVIATLEVEAGVIVVVGFDLFDVSAVVARVVSNALRWGVRFADSDRDGIPDHVERRHGLEPANPADGARDLDEDGISNSTEFATGTAIDDPDTDGDGALDGEERRDDRSDPLVADTDGDGVDDGDDPFPRQRLTVRLLAPTLGLVDQASAVTLELTNADEPVFLPVRLRIRMVGPARFAGSARVGTLRAGGGTSVVEIETDDGFATIDVFPDAPGELRFEVDDAFRTGVVFVPQKRLDFDLCAGGFTRSSAVDEWEWGAPLTGPERARSGERLWGVDLDGSYDDDSRSVLTSPEILLAAPGAVELELWQWISTELCCDIARIEIAVDDEPFDALPPLLELSGPRGGFERLRIDLTRFAGQRIRLRFVLESNGSSAWQGWYIDDVTLRGIDAAVSVLESSLDADEDGVPNGDEVSRGTDPLTIDSDSDGLTDLVETASGVFVGLDDTGSDPLRGDTDGAGMGDRLEVELGLDPNDDSDDTVARMVVWTPLSSSLAVDRSLDLLRTRFRDVEVELSSAAEGGQLESDLAGAHVLLVPPLDAAPTDAEVRARGRGLADAISGFVRSGAVVVGLSVEATSLFSGAGLLTGSATSVSDIGDRVEVVDPGHFLARGLADSSAAPAGSNTWRVLEPSVDVAARRASDGGPVAISKRVEHGHVVLIGFDAAQQSDVFARVLTSAVRRGFHFLDTDGDRIPNLSEIDNGLDPRDRADADADPDADGLANREEIANHTDPRNPDSDDDGVGDGEEVLRRGSDPNDPDSDDDGVGDAEDPFVSGVLRVELTAPQILLEGEPGVLGIIVSLAGGSPGMDVRLTVSAPGSVVFDGAALAGRVLEGGGSSRVLVETRRDRVGLALVAAASGVVSVAVEDTEGFGVDVAAARVSVRVLGRDGDEDLDGLSNADELERGVDPFDPDSDGDGLLDGVETGTGTYVGDEDTGTDPLDADSDGGGVADGEEVGLGLDPNDPGDDVVEATLPVAFEGADGRPLRIEADGSIAAVGAGWRSGSNLQVGGHGFPGLERAIVRPLHRTLLIGPVAMNGVEVTRHVFVPGTGAPFVRYLEVLENPGDRTISRRVFVISELVAACPGRTGCDAVTSSGDREFDSDDRWVVVSTGDTSAAIGTLFGGSQTPADPVVTQVTTDGRVIWAYDLTIPPGQKRVILHYEYSADDSGTALTRAAFLSRLSGRTLDFIDVDLLLDVVNFDDDSDGDGVSDVVEDRFGMDPGDPGDADLDPDEDGLVTRVELRLRTDHLDADSDDDGLLDGVEVNELGSDPLDPDTDGDGALDGSDPFILEEMVLEIFAGGPAAFGEPARVSFRIARRDGVAPRNAPPVRFTIGVTGGALWAESGLGGSVISGGGTSEALVEAIDGTVEVDLRGIEPGAVRIHARDSENRGLRDAGLFAPVGFGFEDGEEGWTHRVLGGPAHEWNRTDVRSFDGVYSFHSGVSASQASHAVLESPPIRLEVARRPLLQFAHWAEHDDCDRPDFFADGGVVELRVLPGGSWTTLEPERGYPHILGGSSCDSPISGAGHSGAFSGTTGGDFELVRCPIAFAAGEEIRVRFHVGWDCGNCRIAEGWYIDDVRIIEDDPGNNSVVEFLEADGEIFVRGDANSDDRVDLSDAVRIINSLFLGGPSPSPLDSADVDDDGALNVTDAIRVLDFLFRGGPRPPAPFPFPGGDPTQDDLVD